MDTWYFSSNVINDVEKILEYINKRTQVRVAIRRGVFENLYKSLLPIIFIGGLIFLVFKLRFLIKNPNSWLVIALFVFFFCCAGIIHNILHHAPAYGKTRNEQGEIEYEYIATGVNIYIYITIYRVENNMQQKDLWLHF